MKENFLRTCHKNQQSTHAGVCSMCMSFKSESPVRWVGPEVPRQQTESAHQDVYQPGQSCKCVQLQRENQEVYAAYVKP